MKSRQPKKHVHRQLDVSFDRRGGLRRRDWLKVAGVSGIGVPGIGWMNQLAGYAPKLRQQNQACILLWMQGGPSQFETFSPQPTNASGGETKAISTAVPGTQIAEHLPQTAKIMDQLCLIRSMQSKEGSHPRATHLMQTGFLPTASVKYPAFGAHVAQQLGDPDAELPDFVTIGRRRGNAGGGFLGVDYDPFKISNPEEIPDNTQLTTTEARYRRRLGLLDQLQSDYEATGGEEEVADQRKLYAKSSRMILSKDMAAFDIQQESSQTRAAYGNSSFGKGCLLARRLVETGVSFVEVSLGNWDTHQDNFNRSKDLCEQMDQPFAQLIRDLQQRDMLERTLVLWMGEFGRTPRSNGRGGRDHFPRAFNVALAGSGVQGGQVIGKTTAGGGDVADDPVKVNDLLRTVCHSLKIDADQENMSAAGRPIRVVDDGQVVEKVFG